MLIGLLGQSKVGKDTAGAVIAAELGGVCVAFADPIKRWCMKALGLTEKQLWGDTKEKPISKKHIQSLVPRPRKDGKVRLVLGPLFGHPTPTPWGDALDAACGFKTQGHTNHVDAPRVQQEIQFQRWWDELSREKGLTPRRVMQHFGTEFIRRRRGKRFWIDVGLHAAQDVLEGGVMYSRTKGVTPIKGAAPNCNAVVFTDVRFRNEVLAIKRAGGLVYGVFRSDMKKSKGAARGHASETEQLSVPRFWLDGVLLNRYDTAEKFQNAVRYFAQNRLLTRGPVIN
jgi:hypothetical protein